MSCERAKDLMIDALVEPLDEQQMTELQAHVAECESCAAEMAEIQNLWQHLGAIAIPEPSAGGLERLQAAIRDEFGDEMNLTRRATYPSYSARLGIWRRVAAVIALIGVGALLSIGLDSYLRESGPQDVADDDRARYLLIMTATREGPELAGQVQSETQQWLASLIDQGILESGFGIGDAMPNAMPRSGTLLNGPVSGFMIIRATDLQEARRIVLDSPVIRYGGLIEIREIDDDDSSE